MMEMEAVMKIATALLAIAGVVAGWLVVAVARDTYDDDSDLKEYDDWQRLP